MEQNQQLNFVEDINGEKKNWKIKVKVLSMWKQYYSNNPNNASSIDMILIDEKGTKISASFKSMLFGDFENLFEEGYICIISKFIVTPNVGSFRLTKHASKIFFQKDTDVQNCTDFESEDDGYDFVSFSDLVTDKVPTNVAFDVIGELISNNPIRVMQTQGITRRVIECKLQNLDGIEVGCALWDAHATKLQDFITANMKKDMPIIIVIQLAKFNKWRNQVQVSNCIFGSKVFINDDVHMSRMTLMKSLLANNSQEHVTEVRQKLSTQVVYTKAEDYYLQFPAITIDKLFDVTEPGPYVIIATIRRIQNEQGWYYLACRMCNKKVERKNPATDDEAANSSSPFTCEDCGDVSDVYHRIKVHVRVQDSTGSISFCFFQQDVTKLICKPYSYLIGKIAKLEDNQYPDEFNTMLDKQFTFKIHISKFNLKYNYHVYTVQKLTDDKSVITAVKNNTPQHEEDPPEDDDKLSDNEGTEDEYNENECTDLDSDENEETNKESENDEAPAMKKPVKGTSKDLKKRKHFSTEDDDLHSDENEETNEETKNDEAPATNKPVKGTAKDPKKRKDFNTEDDDLIVISEKRKKQSKGCKKKSPKIATD